MSGFFLGFLLGPIGLIYMALQKHVNDECKAINKSMEAKAKQEGNTRGSKDYYVKAGKDEWNTVRTAVLSAIEKFQTRIKQNDGGRFYAEVEDSGYVQMCPYYATDGEYIFVRSLNAGEIAFGDLPNIITEDMPSGK